MVLFWTVYFAATLALISQFLIEGVYADYLKKKRHKDLLAYMEKLEDEWADDEDDEDEEDED